MSIDDKSTIILAQIPAAQVFMTPRTAVYGWRRFTTRTDIPAFYKALVASGDLCVACIARADMVL